MAILSLVPFMALLHINNSLPYFSFGYFSLAQLTMLLKENIDLFMCYVCISIYVCVYIHICTYTYIPSTSAMYLEVKKYASK